MIVRLASVLLVLLSLTLAAAAEERAKTLPPAANTRPSVGGSAAQVPEGTALSILIRRTLLTLNDANLTGNYTVMRDVAAPGFQSANDPAKLAGIFAKLRENKIDLAPIIYFEPKLVRQPEITANGMLRVSGFVPTRPQQVNFDMLFQKVADHWRLFGIAVNTTIAQPEAASLGPADATTANSAAAKSK